MRMSDPFFFFFFFNADDGIASASWKFRSPLHSRGMQEAGRVDTVLFCFALSCLVLGGNPPYACNCCMYQGSRVSGWI